MKPLEEAKIEPPREDDFHCPQCLYLPDPLQPDQGFWACQNLCVREE